MPLDELLGKYQPVGPDDDDNDDVSHFLYSPASLSAASDTSDGKFISVNSCTDAVLSYPLP